MEEEREAAARAKAEGAPGQGPEERTPRDAGAKRYGTGLVMGTFDLFHVGHLRLIRRAKAECAFLRVALLSDELVMQFKHHPPVIPLAERLEIVAALRDVDEAVAITDTPSRLVEWRRRPFDCFFSGDDYAGDPWWSVEREELRKLGSDIRFFPYTRTQSSTKIRKTIGDGPRAGVPENTGEGGTGRT